MGVTVLHFYVKPVKRYYGEKTVNGSSAQLSVIYTNCNTRLTMEYCCIDFQGADAGKLSRVIRLLMFHSIGYM